MPTYPTYFFGACHRNQTYFFIWPNQNNNFRDYKGNKSYTKDPVNTRVVFLKITKFYNNSNIEVL